MSKFMILTVAGRLHTKIIATMILMVVTIPFTLMGGFVYILMGIISTGVGFLLEWIWGALIEYQPGWLTWVLAGVEFCAIVSVATLLSLSMPMMSAVLYYTVTWSVTQLFLLYLLPVWRLNWNDNGGELF